MGNDKQQWKNVLSQNILTHKKTLIHWPLFYGLYISEIYKKVLGYFYHVNITSVWRDKYI